MQKKSWHIWKDSQQNYYALLQTSFLKPPFLTISVVCLFGHKGVIDGFLWAQGCRRRKTKYIFESTLAWRFLER